MALIDDKSQDPDANQAHLLALADLARNDHTRLYRFILRRVHDPAASEEIAQQCLADAVQSISRYRGDSQLRTWVYGIAINLISNYVRRSPQRRYQFETEEAMEDQPSMMADPLTSITHQRLLERVFAHLEQLPVEMQETLIAVVTDDVSYVEVAERLQVPVGTVRSRVSRARSILRDHLAAEGLSVERDLFE